MISSTSLVVDAFEKQAEIKRSTLQNLKPVTIEKDNKQKNLISLNEKIKEFNKAKDLKSQHKLMVKIFFKTTKALKTTAATSPIYSELCSLQQLIEGNLLLSENNLFVSSAQKTLNIKNSKFSDLIKKLICEPYSKDYESEFDRYVDLFKSNAEIPFDQLNRLLNHLLDYRKFLITQSKNITDLNEISKISDIFITVIDVVRNIIKSNLPHIDLIKRTIISRTHFSNKVLDFFNKIDAEFFKLLRDKFEILQTKLANQGILITKLGGQIPVYKVEIDGQTFALKNYAIYTGGDEDYKESYDRLITVRKRLGDKEELIGITSLEKEFFYIGENKPYARLAFTPYFPLELQHKKMKNHPFARRNLETIADAQDTRIETAIELVEALKLLNKKGILNTDFKTSNVRRDENGAIRFTDTKWLRVWDGGDHIPLRGYDTTEAYLSSKVKALLESDSKDKTYNYKESQNSTLGMVLCELFTNDEDLKFSKNSNPLFAIPHPVPKEKQTHIVKGNKTVEWKTLRDNNFDNHIIFKGNKGEELKKLILDLQDDTTVKSIDLDIVLNTLKLALKIKNVKKETDNFRKQTKAHIALIPENVPGKPAKPKVPDKVSLSPQYRSTSFQSPAPSSPAENEHKASPPNRLKSLSAPPRPNRPF